MSSDYDEEEEQEETLKQEKETISQHFRRKMREADLGPVLQQQVESFLHDMIDRFFDELPNMVKVSVRLGGTTVAQKLIDKVIVRIKQKYPQFASEIDSFESVISQPDFVSSVGHSAQTVINVLKKGQKMLRSGRSTKSFK
jgi:hypothetical protein